MISIKIACLTAKHSLAPKYNKATVKREIPFTSSSLAIFLYRGSFLLTKMCTALQNDQFVSSNCLGGVEKLFCVILNSVTDITTAQTQFTSQYRVLCHVYYVA